MTEPEVQPTDEDLTALYATLAALDLPAPQRLLLNSIVAIAQDMTHVDESIQEQFAQSFTAGPAATLASYAHGGPLLISRSASGHAALISRLISR
ncbi:hypothetical protein [Dactylosporangium sp. NPDC049140]|jgi:hypothetical protein|uniref:hypothetical protein n=1 Tax=Dactylosporangium sp. NPDC049140 TaxID=3155647 RepID=UPI0033C44C77